MKQMNQPSSRLDSLDSDFEVGIEKETDIQIGAKMAMIN